MYIWVARYHSRTRLTFQACSLDPKKLLVSSALQACRQGFATGGRQKATRGENPSTYNIGCMQQPGANMKWEAQILNGGPSTTPPSLVTALLPLATTSVRGAFTTEAGSSFAEYWETCFLDCKKAQRITGTWWWLVWSTFHCRCSTCPGSTLLCLTRRFTLKLWRMLSSTCLTSGQCLTSEWNRFATWSKIRHFRVSCQLCVKSFHSGTKTPVLPKLRLIALNVNYYRSKLVFDCFVWRLGTLCRCTSTSGIAQSVLRTRELSSCVLQCMTYWLIFTILVQACHGTAVQNQTKKVA